MHHKHMRHAKAFFHLYTLVLLHALNAVHHLDLMRIITEDVYRPLLLAHIQFMENIASNR